MYNFAEVKNQVDQIITYTQDIECPQTDDMLDRWQTNKSFFIDQISAAGSKDGLIYEWPEEVHFELDDESKEEEIEKFLTYTHNLGYYDLYNFITKQKDGFFSNKVIEDYEFKNIIIKKGMKLSKSFKYFISDSDKLVDYQMAVSAIIQKDKISGKLCFSVHPCDFLTSSDNDCNWRSCHSLDGGEYMAGNLSYIVDPTTVICYLKEKEDKEINGITWNSKKWRVLLYFSEDKNLVFAGRQYPFSSSSGMDFLRKNIFSKLHLGKWSNWTDKKMSRWSDGPDIDFEYYSPLIPLYRSMVPLNEIVMDGPNSLMFNDVLRSTVYEPIYSIKYEDKGDDILSYPHFYFKRTMPISKELSKIVVGGAVKCLRCGKNHIKLTESMMCNDCFLEYGGESEEVETCFCCERRFFTDEGTYVAGSNVWLCSDCAAEEADFCDNCNELYLNRNLIWHEKLQRNFCKYCWNDLEEEIENGSY